MRRINIVATIAMLACNAAADEVTVRGTVVSPRGEPVAGATVQCPYLRTRPTRQYVWGKATTGPDGRFALRVETEPWLKDHVLLASKEGYAAGLTRVKKPGEEARLELGDEPTSLRGTVVDPQGGPLPAVEVAIRWISFPYRVEGMQFHDGYLVHYPGSPLRALSDETGRFAIEALPAEAHVSIEARGPGLADYESSGRPPPVSEALTITMYPEARISGRVLRDGEPVAGERVHASTAERGAAGRAESGETGYSIGSLPAGTYTVSVLWQDDYVAEPKTGLTVEAGEHLQGVDLELIEGAIIEGLVMHKGSGLPAADVGIRFTHADIPKWTYGASTDEKGCYRQRVAPGRLEVRVSDRWRASAEPKRVSLEVENGEHRTGVDFVVGPRAEECTALLIDPDGEPLAGAEVWLLTAARVYPPPKPELSDDQGRAPLGRAPTGLRARPSVFAQHRGLGLAGLAPLVLEGGTTEVRLRPAAYAIAEVADLEGRSLSVGGAHVSVFADGLNPHGIPAPYRADEDGVLRIGPLPPGVPLMIRPDGQASAMAVEDWGQGEMAVEDWAQGGMAVEDWAQAERPTLAPGQTLELPPLRLNPDGRTLAGTVVDDQERPAAALVFCTETVSLEPFTVKTDGQGRFELLGLKSRDTVTVIAVAADGKRACGMLCDPELAFEPVFTLEPAGVIEGTVYQPDGKPKARAVVHVQCTDLYTRVEPHEGLVLMRNVVADERGHYRIEGMVPGIMYSISSHDYETGQHGWVDQFVAAGGPEPVILDIRLEEEER